MNKPKNKDRLTAWEIQQCIGLLMQKAESQQAAEQGAMAAAIAISIATRGPVAAVDYVRNISDEVERDMVLRAGERIQ